MRDATSPRPCEEHTGLIDATNWTAPYRKKVLSKKLRSADCNPARCHNAAECGIPPCKFIKKDWSIPAYRSLVTRRVSGHRLQIHRRHARNYQPATSVGDMDIWNAPWW